MDTLETRQLLGYTLETFDIREFKEYYDAHTNKFNDFARKAFLKALSIPPTYFLEQPEETRDELLCNKLELAKVHTKYQGLSILVVSKGDEILNAAKIKTNEIELRYEAISSIEDVKNIIWSRSLIKDGYICGYLVCGTVSREGYNKAIFVDFPILFTKPTLVHEGYIKLANANMVVEKDMVYYDDDYQVSYEEFQHVAIAIDHYLENIDKDIVSLDKEEDHLILKTPIEAVCELVEKEVVPKSMVLHIAEFIDKNIIEEGKELKTSNLVEAILAFDNNVKVIKNINALRSCKPVIYSIFIEEGKENQT